MTTAAEQQQEHIKNEKPSSSSSGEGSPNTGDAGGRKKRSKAWQTAKEKQEDLDEVTEELYKTVLPLNFISREMSNEVRDGYLVRELYVYIPFMILFMFFSMNQLPIQRSHYAIQALKDTVVEKQFASVQVQSEALWKTLQANEQVMMNIDKRHEDIANHGDWLAWIQQTSQELWHCGNQSQAYPTVPNPPYSTENIVDGMMPTPMRGNMYGIGNVRLRTLRVRSDSCSLSSDVVVDPTVNPNRYAITDKSCYSGHKDEFEDKTSWCNLTNPLASAFNQSATMYEYTDCADISGSWTSTEQGAYQCGGYLMEIPFAASCSQAMEVVAALQDTTCPYVDAISTRFVILEFFAYSPSLDAFFSVKAFNEVTPGGAWIPDIQFRAFAVWTPNMLLQTVLDFVFLVFVLYYLVNFFTNLKKFYHDERSILRFFLVAWNMIEFINVATFIAVFALRWIWWSYSNSVHKTFPYPDAYPALEQPLWTFSQMRYAMAFNFILTFLKVLKYLKISQKLNIISVTFEKAQTDVVGLLIIFFLVLTGYAVAGTSIFGTQMWWFSTVSRSFSGLMFMLMGQMDYQAMKKVNPLITGFYFWSFLILSFFLLLNFIVAVVSEAFNAAGAQEWSLPLSDAFELSIGSLGRSLRPSSISREIKYAWSGQSSLYLRSQALSYIKQNEVYLKLKYPTSLDIPVQASEVLKWMPSSIRKKYAPLFEEDWQMFRAMHKLQAESVDEQLVKQRKETVVDGCRRVIRGSVVTADIEAMRTSLVELEASAKNAIKAVRKKLGKQEEVDLQNLRRGSRAKGRRESNMMKSFDIGLDSGRNSSRTKNRAARKEASIDFGPL